MKLKKSSIEAVEEAQSSKGGAFISARHRNPAEELALQVSDGSDKLAGVCAIIATLLMLIVTAMLYVNWDAIKAA